MVMCKMTRATITRPLIVCPSERLFNSKREIEDGNRNERIDDTRIPYTPTTCFLNVLERTLLSRLLQSISTHYSTDTTLRCMRNTGDTTSIQPHQTPSATTPRTLRRRLHRSHHATASLPSTTPPSIHRRESLRVPRIAFRPSPATSKVYGSALFVGQLGCVDASSFRLCRMRDEIDFWKDSWHTFAPTSSRELLDPEHLEFHVLDQWDYLLLRFPPIHCRI